jgi:hypothetical protein
MGQYKIRTTSFLQSRLFLQFLSKFTLFVKIRFSSLIANYNKVLKVFNFKYGEVLINTSAYQKSKYYLCAAILNCIDKLRIMSIKLLSLCKTKASLDQIYEHSERNQTFYFS